MSNDKDTLVNGDYMIKNEQKNLAIQIDDDGNVTMERHDKTNKAQQWKSTYKGDGQGGYGHYTFQSVGYDDYYLSSDGDHDGSKVKGVSAKVQWWAGGVPNSEGTLRLICTTTTSEWNAISVEGADKAGDEIFIRHFKPDPTQGWGRIQNWGTDADHWALLSV